MMHEITKEALKTFFTTAASVAATKGVEHLYERHTAKKPLIIKVRPKLP